jgi:hypothetical protein
MFANKNIKKRIMSVIESRIKNAQNAFDTECVKLDDDHRKAIIDLGWIKPVEDKKLTEEEIHKEIVSLWLNILNKYEI